MKNVLIVCKVLIIVVRKCVSILVLVNFELILKRGNVLIQKKFFLRKIAFLIIILLNAFLFKYFKILQEIILIFSIYLFIVDFNLVI
jgi:hypothetical protein